MTSPVTTSTYSSAERSYNYDNRAQRWRDSVNGQWVSENRVNEEMFRHSDATHATLEALTRQLYSGKIGLAEWQIAVASELKDAHLAQAMFAAGGRANMGNVEFGRVGQTLREQYAYLNNFAKQIANGEVSLGQALNRIEMYGEACKASYWNEYLDKSELVYWNANYDARECEICPQIAAGSPYKKGELKQVPADGQTPCKTRCRCTLSREN